MDPALFFILLILFILPWPEEINRICNVIYWIVTIPVLLFCFVVIACFFSAAGFSSNKREYVDHSSTGYTPYEYKPDLSPRPTPAPGRYIEITNSINKERLPGTTWILDFGGVRTKDNTAHAVWYISPEQYESLPAGTWVANDSEVWCKK